MKKHVKYILYIVLIIIVIILAGLTLLTNQFFKFYNSYLNEEKEEINHQLLLVEWAITPIIKENNLNRLKKFSKDLTDVDIAIFVIDADGKLLVSSRPDIDVNNVKIDDFSKKVFKNYKHTIKSKMIAKEKSIVVDNKTYTIIIALLQDSMIATFLKNQQSIILFFLAGVLSVIVLSVYVIFYIKLPFDRLQESAIKIIKGNLDTDIFIIEKGMLAEHSKTINDMSKQLKQKIKELEFMESCKNEMLSGFAHEVKTPLTSIVLASEILISEKDEKSECTNIIKTNVDRLNSLILSIIDIANLEQKSLNRYREFSTFHLEDCIFSAINNSKILANNLPINFNPENSISIYADFQALETAVSNILANAIKYSKTDVIDITMSSAGSNAEIRIKDYGIGIAEKHLKKIFDKFYRIDKDRSRELGGSGLGLAIVKQIVELHKGSIEVISENGCEFIIVLPLSNNS